MRADHHGPEDTDDARICSLCSSYVWVSLRATRFLDMNPTVPAICCVCAELTMNQLMAAYPGLGFLGRDVPDLSRQGVFN